MEYTPENLVKLDEKELRKEYTRFRDMAQKRLKRLKNEGFGNSSIVNYFGGDVPKLKSLPDKEAIAFGLAELKGFIDAKQSTVKGMRAYIKEEREKAEKVDKRLKSVMDTINRRFRSKGENLDNDTIKQFFDFMNDEVTKNVGEMGGWSDRIVMLFRVAKQKGIKNLKPMLKTEKDLIFFLNNLENLEAVELPKGKHKSVKAYKEAIESEIYHGRDRSEFYKQQFYEDLRGRRTTRNSKRTRRKK